MELEKLVVKITAETADLKKEMKSVTKDVGDMKKEVEKQTNSIGNIFSGLGKKISKALIAAFSIKQMITFGKKALETASDLAEVQNVVDVAFGSMRTDVEDFARTALKQFGLSELAAKRTSSTYKAMANSMGVLEDAGTKMSINLAKLSADMASFYNVEQDVSSTALRSVFTGETEALKKFGVVMTEANLKAFALSQGITKQYSAMSEAEKVMLRYQYVMNATSDAQGDFARTSGSWANQTKLLREQFTQLGSVIGNILIHYLLPLLQVLNKILSLVINVANAFASAFGGQVLSSTEAATEGFGGASEAISDANKNAKALKKTLIGGFDELNVLQGDGGSSSTGIGGGGSAISELFNVDDYVDVTKYIDETDSKITKIFESAKNQAKTAFSEMRAAYDKWFTNLPQLHLNINWEEIDNSLHTIYTSIINTIAGWGSFAIDLGINILNDLDLGSLIESLSTVIAKFSAVVSTVTDILIPAFKKFYDMALKPIVQWISGKVKDALDWFGEKLSELQEFVKDHTQGIQDWITVIGALIRSVWDFLAPFLDGTWDGFKQLLDGIWNIVLTIGGAFLDLSTIIITAFNDPQQALQDFKDLCSETWDKVVSGASYAWEGVKKIWSTFSDFFSTIFGNAWEKIKKMLTVGGKIFDGIKEGIVESFKSIVNAIIKGINKVVSIPFNGINTALRKIRDVNILGITPFKNLIKTVSVPQIPLLAKGGILDKPTFAMLGEYAGSKTNPEIATPEKLLTQIIQSNNSDLIAAFAQMTRQLIAVIEALNLEVSIGDDAIAKSAARGNQNNIFRTGEPLF